MLPKSLQVDFYQQKKNLNIDSKRQNLEEKDFIEHL